VLIALMADRAARKLRSDTSIASSSPFRAIPAVALACTVLLSGLLAYRHLTRFHESISHDTDRTVAFVRQVRGIAKDDVLVVIVRGKHPIPTLLGRHQGDYLTPRDIAASTWVILPEQPDHVAAALSEPVPVGFETIGQRPHFRLGLYRTADFAPDYRTLIDLQRSVGEWSREENPYHRPGTVYRDNAP
jgi:hypothetical protein